MKKPIALLFATVCALCLLAPCPAFASGAGAETTAVTTAAETTTTADESSEPELLTSGDCTYTLDAETGEAQIYAYTGAETDLALPEELDGHPVTSLRAAALLNLPNLKTLHIPASIVSVGDSCFYGCNALEEITVDADNPALKSEGGVLYSVDDLYLYCYPPAKEGSAYTIADGVVEIMPSAFANSASLTDVAFPDSLLYIDNWAFAYSGITSLVMPDSVTELGQYAFAYCTGLTQVTFPESLELIEAACFGGCSNLASVTFSDAGNLNEIQMAAFSGTAMEEVTIPSSVTDIGYCAFGYESNLSTKVHGFTIRGETGSQAQVYCTESDEENDYQNDFNFESVNAQTVATPTTTADNDPNFLERYGRILILAAVGVVLLVAAISLVFFSRKPKDKK